MAGPWKAWKTKGGFSILPSAPWESRKNREIPTFPQPRRRIPLHPAKAELPEELATLEKWKSKSGIPTFPPSQNRLRRKVKSLKTNTKGESCRFTKPRTFRIILYWNQKSFSGSFFNWKMLRASVSEAWPARIIFASQQFRVGQLVTNSCSFSTV